MKLKELVEGVVCDVNNEEIEIENLAFDSNLKNKNGVFFCLRGSKEDGHDHYLKAIENGAKVLVVEKKLECDVPQIVVSSTRKALSKMAGNFFGNPAREMKMIAITGTNGKTTTSYLTKNIFEKSGVKVGLIGTNGVFIGSEKIAQNLTTPDPIDLHCYLKQMKDAGCGVVVMEASAHAIYLNKLYGIKFDVLSLTNLTQDHLDYFKTMANYSSVKESFFHPFYANKMLVNLDDELGKKIADKGFENCFSYKLFRGGDFSLYPFETKISGSKFLLVLKNYCDEVGCSLIGNFNLSNILCASGICSLAGVKNENIVEGISTFGSVPGRFNVFENKEKKNHVIIDFAHTPDGLEKILTTARNLCHGNLISVFGCGGNRDSSKRKMMGAISSKIADYSIITSDNPRFENPMDIIKQIKKGFKSDKNVEIIENRREAIKHAIKISSPYDVIVICGKGAEDYQEIKGVKHRFLDEEEVKNCLHKKDEMNNQNSFNIE